MDTNNKINFMLARTDKEKKQLKKLVFYN